MNQAPDADGIVRRVPLVIRFGSQLFPTLSLEMFRVYNFIESYELVTQLYGDVELVQAVRVGKGVGSFEIPTDGFGQVNVPYVAGSSLVLVGTSAPGLGDLRAMPLQQVYPGVEVHANMLNALLGSRTVLEVSFGSASTESVFAGFSGAGDVLFPYRPDWEAGALLFIIMVLGVAMAIIFPHLGAASMAATAITLSIASVWINFQLWANFKMDFALVLLLLLILLVTAVNMIYGFLSESQTRRTIKGMFDRYVPPAHIDSMLEDPDNCTFEGESKELTVLFSDIRSFTTISEALSATELKTLLNDFFTPITEIIFKHNGTIDKYVGDMVMAFWGAPLDDPQHRENAIIAGLEMLEKVEELKPEFTARGYPEVNVGVGINTGFMNVGDMGSTYRRSYTVLGDAVNLGSRLEGLTKFYGIRLLVGEETARELPGFLLRLIDKVMVKGKYKAVECCQPICREVDADAAMRARVDEYYEALDCYHKQDWDGAEARLNDLLEKEPDTLLYQVYLERIETLREAELPEDWDGAFTHTSK